MSIKTAHDRTDPTDTRRLWLRLLALYLLLPLILLVCGGDAGWWQAWLYSLLLFIAGMGGHLWADLQHPGLLADRQNLETLQSAKAWDKVLAPLMALGIGLPMVVVAGLDHRCQGSPPFSLWLTGLGFVLTGAGYLFAVWALAENRFFYSVVCIHTERGHVVCDSGPYRWVRHPGYAGNIVALFGIVLALGSLWTLIPAAVTTIITVVRTALEDRTLQAELPGYRDYAARVRYRLLPGIY